jgi:hypothetical protein
MTDEIVHRSFLMWRNLSVGFCGALFVSIFFQALAPLLGTRNYLLMFLAIFLAFGLLCVMPTLRSHMTGSTLFVAFVTVFLVNCAPVPALSIGARVGFYAQLARYKNQLDKQCAPTSTCKDTSHVLTLQTEAHFPIIQGLARDDSGELLNIIQNHGSAPRPLQGCENGIVHLYGPYFHWECG